MTNWILLGHIREKCVILQSLKCLMCCPMSHCARHISYITILTNAAWVRCLIPQKCVSKNKVQV